jgi:hypothetical protein
VIKLALFIAGGILLVCCAILLTGRGAGIFTESSWFENDRLKTPHKIGVAISAVIVALLMGRVLFEYLGL